MAKFNITLLNPLFGLKDTVGDKKKFLTADSVLHHGRRFVHYEEEPLTDKSELTSMLGTEVLDTLEFDADSDERGNRYNGLRIDAVLLTVSQTKNIVKTSIQGRNGTVKEYISDGDYMITVTGVIIGESLKSGDSFSMKDIGNRYPEKDVEELKQIMIIDDTVKVTSKFLNRFGIENVVIESYRFEQIAGMYNTQAFEIQMLSDNNPLTFEVQ